MKFAAHERDPVSGCGPDRRLMAGAGSANMLPRSLVQS